jgi:predicted aspartyl protease
MERTGKNMGRFVVELEIVNNENWVRAKNGDIEPAKVRRKTIPGVVDSGAAYLVLPKSVAVELGLPIKAKKIKVRYADGRRATRAEADEIRLNLLGRDGLFAAIVEPNRDTALIGAIVLDALDLLVDCNHQRLVPRDPDMILSEIE